MGRHLRFLPAGSDALLVEMEDLKSTLTLLDSILSANLPGVRQLVPGACTVMIHFNPLVTDRYKLSEYVARIDMSERSARGGMMHEIPVNYDGEDLGEVASFLGWTIEEVVRRHTEATYTVAFTGFAPGFAYMTCDDTAFDVPRRKSPRTRIPAGSVAIAGKFGGIYPTDSPGGWQLLGTTPMRMWSTERSPPALLAPGDRVRFRDMAKGSVVHATALPERPPRVTPPTEGLRVTRADRPALFQDLGRPGQANQGLSESGGVDRGALREANLLVGNPCDAATIEITFGGFALTTDRAITIAVTGAPCPMAIRTSNGSKVKAPFALPFALDAFDELTLGAPQEGIRSYLALRGGFIVTPVLGSSSTDTLAKVGPSSIVSDDVLAPANRPAFAVDPGMPEPRRLPRAGETVVLNVILGPRTDWFTEEGVETLVTQAWEVTAESSRVGMRLSGSVPLERRSTDELPSEGTVLGAIQVPHNGQPVLFLADHPVTGGYPVIGVVVSKHLDLAGQIPIGAKIRFNAVAAFEPEVKEASQ